MTEFTICGVCIFWRELAPVTVDEEVQDIRGSCCRRAPVVVGTAGENCRSVRPTTAPSEGCGEGRKKSSSKAFADDPEEG